MKKNNFNQRRCVFSRQRLPKNELFRLVLVNNEIVYDHTQTIPGRGYYFGKTKKNVEILKHSNYLNKIFNKKPHSELFEILEQEVNKRDPQTVLIDTKKPN